ncbi:MAG: hypothetical protein HYX60_10040, partial [Legionella longbeachae]|nr:hypothetical protein [Legionella longbeachae]
MQNITTQNLIQLSEINFQNFEETLQVQKAILPDNIQQWDKETWLNAILKFFPSLHENFVAEELRRSGSKNRLFGAHANFLNFVDSSELVRFFFEFKQMYFDRLSDNRKKLWMDIITEDVDALSSSYLSPELLFSKFGENRLEILENWNPSPCEVVHKNSLLQKVLFQNIQSTFKKSNLKEDGAGRALLHYAAALGITDICLSFSNKDYLKKDNKGQTPIEYAIRYRQQECVLNILASKKISGPLIESMGVKLTRSAIRFYLMDVVAFLIEQESVLKEITTQHNEIFTEIARCGQHTLLKKLRNHPEIIKLIKISGDATIK